jgi:hypothetical protein
MNAERKLLEHGSSSFWTMSADADDPRPLPFSRRLLDMQLISNLHITITIRKDRNPKCLRIGNFPRFDSAACFILCQKFKGTKWQVSKKGKKNGQLKMSWTFLISAWSGTGHVHFPMSNLIQLVHASVPLASVYSANLHSLSSYVMRAETAAAWDRGCPNRGIRGGVEFWNEPSWARWLRTGPSLRKFVGDAMRQIPSRI